MISHFVSLLAPEKDTKYTLYCHFGVSSEKPMSRHLTLVDLQKILKKKLRRKGSPTINLQHEYGWSDEQLSKFVQHLEITEGPSFAEQQEQLHDMMVNAYSVSASTTTAILFVTSLNWRGRRTRRLGH